MTSNFPKDILDCMRSCILAIFWPRKEIISFFKNNGCTKKDLKEVQNFKKKKLYRSQIVNIVFENLNERNALGPFRSMLQSLINWTYFDPYYFKKLGKLDEEEAKKRINHLKQLQEIRDSKVKKIRKKREKRNKKLNTTNINREKIKNIFLKLFQGKNEKGKVISRQKRGYLFEEFLKKLFLLEELEVTDQFKLQGEQIDGSIKFEGENYLVEAKWQDSMIATESLYHFAYKVEGKMYGRGIFISVNGFSSESISGLIKAKALNTVLFDGSDLILVVEGRWTLREMLDRKIKAAQTMGRIFVDVNTMKEKYIKGKH